MSSDTLHLENLTAIIREHSKPMLPVPASVESVLAAQDSVKAVVFDIYGTLFLSGVGDISLARFEDRDSAFEDVFKAEGVDMPKDVSGLSVRFHRVIEADHEARKQSGIEFPEVDIREIWKRFLQGVKKDFGVEVVLDDKRIERMAVRFECLVNPVWPAPDVERTLWKLQQSGMAMGIISNAQFFTPLLFEHFYARPASEFGMRDEACIWSYVLREAKPSTRLYEDSARWFSEALHIEPEQVLYIGNDMLNDILPAQKVGYKTALYAGDKRSLRLREDHAECASIKPDLVLTQWPQLLECLL